MSIANRKYIEMTVRCLLLLAMLGTVVFIFVNSMLPPAKSAQQSDTVKDIIVEILPDDSKAENFVEEYIRKIAHFTEYGLLGVEVALYLALFSRRRLSRFALAPVLPFFVGFVDESIQSISKRGPLIEDVWIDIGGFTTFYLITLAVFFGLYFTTRAIASRITAKTEKREENG